MRAPGGHTCTLVFYYYFTDEFWRLTSKKSHILKVVTKLPKPSPQAGNLTACDEHHEIRGHQVLPLTPYTSYTFGYTVVIQ